MKKRKSFKLLALFLVMAMLLTGTAANVMAAGTYTVDKSAGSGGLTSKEKALFCKAVKNLTGVSYIPVAVLGTQVVAGTNYQYLCLGTSTTNPPVTKYYIVTVYKNLKGKASVSTIKELVIDKIKTTGNYTGSDGGWFYNTEVKAGKVNKTAQKAFEKAMAGYTGKGYTIISLLGKKTGSTTYYRFLCKGTTVTADPQTTIDVVTISVNKKGTAKVKGAANLNLAAYS